MLQVFNQSNSQELAMAMMENSSCLSRDRSSLINPSYVTGWSSWSNPSRVETNLPQCDQKDRNSVRKRYIDANNIIIISKLRSVSLHWLVETPGPLADRRSQHCCARRCFDLLLLCTPCGLRMNRCLQHLCCDSPSPCCIRIRNMMTSL